MRTQIQVLGVLHVVTHVLYVLCGGAVLLTGSTIAAVIAAIGGHAIMPLAAFVAASGWIVGGVLICIGLPGTVIGWGLTQHASWARIPGIVLSILNLPAVPLGTAIGIYGLVVLLNPEVGVDSGSARNFGLRKPEPMTDQIKIVAWLHILLGALSMLGGLLIALLAAVIGAALASLGSSHAAPGFLAFFSVGTIVFILVGVFAVPHFIVAWGLLRGAAWARVAGIVLSILSLFHPALGLGTAIAIYSLIVLFRSETIELWRRRAA